MENEMYKKLLAEETVSVPAVQQQFALSYSGARRLVSDLVENGDFSYEGGVVYRRTGKQEDPDPFGDVNDPEAKKEAEEEAEDRQELENYLEALRRRREAIELRRKRRELLNRLREQQEEEESKKGQEEDKKSEEPADGEEKSEPFGSLRYEANLIVAGKLLNWERIDGKSFRMRVKWLAYSSGEEFALVAAFCEDGTIRLSDDGFVWNTLKQGENDEFSARVRLNAAVRTWDRIRCDGDALFVESSVTHLLADAFFLFSAFDRLLDGGGI